MASRFVVAGALSGLALAHSLTATVLSVLCFGVADSVLQPGLTAAIPQLAGEVSVLRAPSARGAVSDAIPAGMGAVSTGGRVLL
jgi:hypothetical protein